MTTQAALGVRAVSAYIPAEGRDNYALAYSLGKEPTFVEERIGISFLPRIAEGEDTSDLAAAAVRELLAEQPTLSMDRIGALVVVTQNPDGAGLPHTASIVQRKLGLPTSTAAFDVSLGCSGYVYGLYLLAGFLEACGISDGVLVTADPYSKILNGRNAATDMLFGDAATATWIGSKPEWSLGAARFGTDGTGSSYLSNNDGLLHMNGRRVLEFARQRVPHAISEVLADEGITANDVDLFLMHQGSLAVVQAIAASFGPLANRFPWNAQNTGNTVSSTIPLLLIQATAAPEVRTVVACGFGVGFSWGTAVLRRSANRK